MKKILFLLFFIFYIAVNNCFAELIKGNISLTDEIPIELYGSWRVEAICIQSTNKKMFDFTSTDIWTLSRNGEIVTLINPISGARADINVRDVKGKTVKFEKRSYYSDEETIETPVLTLHGDNFTGFDRINIKTLNNGNIIREDYVEYKIKGTKISGSSPKEILGI